MAKEHTLRYTDYTMGLFNGCDKRHMAQIDEHNRKVENDLIPDPKDKNRDWPEVKGYVASGRLKMY